MTRETFEGVEFGRCSSCAGLWADILEEDWLKT